MRATLATARATAIERRDRSVRRGRDSRRIATRASGASDDDSYGDVDGRVHVSRSAPALPRRDAIVALATAATTLTMSGGASASGPLCGYFDEFSAGVVPKYAYDTPWNEGVVSGATFVRGVGDYKKAKKAKKAPVLAIANGPGIAHGYMSALETLSGEAGGAREVFLYDQRGCGRSAKAQEYNLALFLDELRDIVRELKLVEEGGAHVLAHGYWGTRLATTLALDTPGFARSMTLVSPTTSRRREVADWRRALDDLSRESREAILAYESDLDPSKRQAYDQALSEFSERFITVRGAKGACTEAALAPRSSDDQRLALTGRRYFSAAGSLADDGLALESMGARLGKNGVRAVRVVRGVRDATTSESAMEIVNAINADSAVGAPFCAYDEVENAGSCVFLDRADYFFETLNICAEQAD